nr:MAG TPA: PROTEIN/DNA Complex catalytic motif, Helix-turn-helix DNA [Bacteriophage sp.]
MMNTYINGDNIHFQGQKLNVPDELLNMVNVDDDLGELRFDPTYFDDSIEVKTRQSKRRVAAYKIDDNGNEITGTRGIFSSGAEVGRVIGIDTILLNKHIKWKSPVKVNGSRWMVEDITDKWNDRWYESKQEVQKMNETMMNTQVTEEVKAEEWKVISKHFPNYEVSNLGNVRKLVKGEYRQVKTKLVKQYGKMTPAFYAYNAELDMNELFYVGQTVAKLFVPKTDKKDNDIRFKDDDKMNVSADNIEHRHTVKYPTFGRKRAARPIEAFQCDESGHEIAGTRHRFHAIATASDFLHCSRTTIANHLKTGEKINCGDYKGWYVEDSIRRPHDINK